MFFELHETVIASDQQYLRRALGLACGLYGLLFAVGASISYVCYDLPRATNPVMRQFVGDSAIAFDALHFVVQLAIGIGMIAVAWRGGWKSLGLVRAAAAWTVLLIGVAGCSIVRYSFNSPMPITLPDLVVLLSMLAPPLPASVFLLALIQARKLGASVVALPICNNCGYQMTSLSQPRCPECGKVYSLDEFYRLSSERNWAR